MGEKGVIFNVQRFCVHDGPGIRTTVFLKGCPLRCAWCHNPEGLSRAAQTLYSPEKCRLCGACAAVCARHAVSESGHTFEREGCVGCGKCARACPFGALETAGRETSAEDVWEIVRRDGIFYSQSGGGLTLSGGEPTAQAGFATALARMARSENVHVCAETCGFCDTETFLRFAENVDLFLFDVKETDPARHRAFTGQDNALILRNLRALDDAGKKTILRCPVIPGYNEREEHFSAVARLANTLKNVRGIELEPYHPLGLSKAARLGVSAEKALDKHMLPRERAEACANVMRGVTDVPVRVS